MQTAECIRKVFGSELTTRRVPMKKQLTPLMMVLGLAASAIAQDKMAGDKMRQ